MVMKNNFIFPVDLFEKKGLLVKDGNRLKYVTSNGTESWTIILSDMERSPFGVIAVNDT